MHKEYKVGDHVYLGVNPKKSSLKMGSYSKLEPIYCGPFEFLDRIGPIAYRIAFHANIIVHNFFHVSLLNNYIHDPNHIIDWNGIQMETEVEFQVEPTHILDNKVTIIWS